MAAHPGCSRRPWILAVTVRRRNTRLGSALSETRKGFGDKVRSAYGDTQPYTQDSGWVSDGRFLMASGPTPLDSPLPTGELPGHSSFQRRVRWVFLGPNGIRAGWRMLIFFALFVVIARLLQAGLKLIPALERWRQAQPKGMFTPGTVLLGETVAALSVILAAVVMTFIEKRSFADYGLRTLGSSLVVHEDTIKENPDLVRRFTRATLKAWEEATNHPEEAAALGHKNFPMVDESLLLAKFKQVPDLMHSASTKGRPFGWMAEEDWKDTIAMLGKYAGLQNTEALPAYYTNQFIP